MKKYILTETQVKKIINQVINEQIPTKGKCVTSLFKNSIIDGDNSDAANKIKTTRFVVTNINGSVKLNGKIYDQRSLKNTVTITPDTTINICIGSSMVLSGGGFREAGISAGPDGLMFTPQVA